MTTPEHLNLARAANHRRTWIGFGAALLVCSVFWYPIILDDEAAGIAALRRAYPGATICFISDPLQEIKRWICGINALAAIGFMVRGLMIRLPSE